MGLIGILLTIAIGMAIWFYYPTADQAKAPATTGVEAVKSTEAIKDFSAEYNARIEAELK